MTNKERDELTTKPEDPTSDMHKGFEKTIAEMDTSLWHRSFFEKFIDDHPFLLGMLYASLCILVVCWAVS